jgi:hypothetical protein
VAFAQSSQIVSRHGVDAANRDCADRCRRKQAQCEIFHRKSPFIQAQAATIVFDSNLCSGLYLANATQTSLFPLDQAIERSGATSESGTSGHSSCARVCPLLDQSGQGRFWTAMVCPLMTHKRHWLCTAAMLSMPVSHRRHSDSGGDAERLGCGAQLGRQSGRAAKILAGERFIP